MSAAEMGNPEQTPAAPPPEGDSERPVLDALGDLLADLNRLEWGARGATADVGPPLAVWSDGGTMYLEAELPEARGLSADVSVHDGRVFIRWSR